MSQTEMSQSKISSTKKVKLAIWDLDNTVWDGVLLEEDVTPRSVALDTIKQFDSVGILNSIVSRNDPQRAKEMLTELDLWDYFLLPQIGWGAKSQSVKRIIDAINIGADTVVFIDDDNFERDEVRDLLPEVRVIDARAINGLTTQPVFVPDIVTDDTRARRAMYAADIKRNEIEADSNEPTESFLAKLDMKFSIFQAREEDLDRAEELTVRTNQLNTTGRTYSYTELENFRVSPDHLVLLARLEDKYGPYGTIGLALIEKDPTKWTIKLLLMSCRIMSRGVGSILMNYIRNAAREANVELTAEFVSNDRNRMMYATYKFNGFKDVNRSGNELRMIGDLTKIAPYPEYVQLSLPENHYAEKDDRHVVS